MRIFAKTDIGKTRQMNQDNYFVSDSDDEIKLFILADGMGGYNGGEVASQTAVQASHDYILNNWCIIEKNSDGITTLLKNATKYANKIVFEKSTKEKELEEMGTTIDVCIIYENILYVSHIGDSRIYIINENEIKQVTSDHTYVQNLVKNGTITEEEALVHPDRHMLLKALGCNENIEPDVFAIKLKMNENILLCSDGLTNMLKDDEIMKIVLNDLVSPENSLIKMANDMGGLDNITVILIKQ